VNGKYCHFFRARAQHPDLALDNLPSCTSGARACSDTSLREGRFTGSHPPQKHVFGFVAAALMLPLERFDA
jgi:hypothetical protein